MCKPVHRETHILSSGPIVCSFQSRSDLCSSVSLATGWRNGVAWGLRAIAQWIDPEKGAVYVLTGTVPPGTTLDDQNDAMVHAYTGFARYLDDLYRDRQSVMESELAED